MSISVVQKAVGLFGLINASCPPAGEMVSKIQWNMNKVASSAN
jgi:hypothetical protein